MIEFSKVNKLALDDLIFMSNTLQKYISVIDKDDIRNLSISIVQIRQNVNKMYNLYSHNIEKGN